jgi:tetratricopeptide (TPR) repeat protein
MKKKNERGHRPLSFTHKQLCRIKKIQKMKQLVYLIVVVFLASCNSNEKFKTNPKDYNNYLEQQSSKTTSKYFELWNSKITSDSTQLMSFANVASEYNRYFKNTGEISYLKKAEQALDKAVEIANINKASYYRALARNYISQHRFREALQMANLALENKTGLTKSQALLFDVHMELGNYTEAHRYLEHIKNMSDFGYLIRVAKWSDFKGDLDTTIKFMEKALTKAESSKNKNLLLWSYTNLADYYGHAGRIEDSYSHYLKALSIDPKNAYAKKGIAWIVFSFEKNSEEALRIMNAVTNTNESPDYFLLKAEIADYMGNEQSKEANLDRFVMSLDNPDYGAMYNTYSVDFYIEKQDYDKALNLAFTETKERPTPESHNLLAYIYLKKGDYKKALNIVEEHIIGKTFEPAILLNVAHIYKANEKFEKVETLKRELADATYELGPASIDEIRSL